MSDASVRVIDGRAVVRVGGSELLAPIAKKATDAVALAEAARDEARNAADTVQATSRYFTTRAAGEAASALNQAFATDDGAGNVIYYKRAVGGSVEIGRAVTPAALAAPDGSTRVGFQYNPAFPYISVAESLRQNLHIDSVGAYGDDPAKDTAAFQEAIEFLSARTIGGVVGGGRLQIGAKRYQLNQAIQFTTGNFLRDVHLSGEGASSTIEQTATDEPTFVIGTGAYMRRSSIRNIRISNTANAGNLIEFAETGAVLLDFDQVDMGQNNPDRHLINIPHGEVYDCRFRGGDWYHDPASTVSAVRVRTQGTTFNENIFENLRVHQAYGAPFFDIENEDLETWLTNNAFRNINFENCRGGGMRICNAKNWVLQNFSFWDAGTYVGHPIHFDANAGYESGSNTLMAIGRKGDSLAAGVRDIYLEGAQDTLILSSFTQASDGPSVDFNHKRATVIGRTLGAINDTNVASFSSEFLRLPGDMYVFGDMGTAGEFQAGGAITAAGNLSTYGRVYVDEVAVLNTQLPTIIKGNDPIQNAMIDVFIHHGLIAAGA